jgi:hypothetical protein
MPESDEAAAEHHLSSHLADFDDKQNELAKEALTQLRRLAELSPKILSLYNQLAQGIARW